MLDEISEFCKSKCLTFNRIEENNLIELRVDNGKLNLKRRGYADQNHSLHEKEFLEELKESFKNE